jgi:hypothetical protein
VSVLAAGSAAQRGAPEGCLRPAEVGLADADVAHLVHPDVVDGDTPCHTATAAHPTPIPRAQCPATPAAATPLSTSAISYAKARARWLLGGRPPRPAGGRAAP